MKGMNFKKAFLLSGILLLSVIVLIQLSWGCDDDDKWDRDCHDKWHCVHHSKPCHPPKIQRVFLDYNPDSDTFIRFTIEGKNFENGTRPVVTLGGEFDLIVTNYSDDYITATLPISEENNFDYGDYRLVVSTCHDSACKCKYCKEHQYKCRCKDRYSLTIAGPQGPQGIANLEIVGTTGEQIPDSSNFKGIVYCSQGFKVTGGWFSQCNLNITLSGPLDDKGAKIDNGWRVEGTMVTATAPAFLHIWAICTKVQ